MIRAVLDTNVIVSGIIKGNGPPGRILAALFRSEFMAVNSSVLLEEMERVSTHPRIRQRYGITPEIAEAVVKSLTFLSDLVELTNVSWRTSRDPGDDLFLVCALEGNAEVVVTGDQDLLTLGAFRGVRLVTPQAFLKLLKT